MAAREVLGLGEIGPAHAEIRDQHRQRVATVKLAGELTVAVDRRHTQRPRTVGEHHHARTEPRAGLDRVVARGYRIDAAIKAVFRPRPKLDARLLVVFAVALHPAGPQRFEDHRCTFVESLAALFHRLTKGCEFAAREATADAEAQPPLAQHVEHDRLLGDAQWVVPR